MRLILSLILGLSLLTSFGQTYFDDGINKEIPWENRSYGELTIELKDTKSELKIWMNDLTLRNEDTTITNFPDRGGNGSFYTKTGEYLLEVRILGQNPIYNLPVHISVGKTTLTLEKEFLIFTGGIPDGINTNNTRQTKRVISRLNKVMDYGRVWSLSGNNTIEYDGFEFAYNWNFHKVLNELIVCKYSNEDSPLCWIQITCDRGCDNCINDNMEMENNSSPVSQFSNSHTDIIIPLGTDVNKGERIIGLLNQLY